MSTVSNARRDRLHLAGIIAVFVTATGLLGYLWSPLLPPGDAAAYVEQALARRLAERTVHLGYIVQLAALVPRFGDAAAPLLSAAWSLVGLAATWSAARALVGRRSTDLVAPLALLGAAPLWTHALFAEVYGPSAAALALAAGLALRGHRAAAAAAAGLAVSMHPGALAWLPTVALLSPRRPGGHAWRDRMLLVVAAAAPCLVLAAIVPADYLLGQRGVLAVAATPHPWPALQRMVRLAAGSAPLLGGLATLGLLDARGRRWAAAMLPGVVLTLLTDWRDDVPAAWPALLLSAPMATLGASWVLERAEHRRGAALVLALLLAAGIGEATSRHDRQRRILSRQVDALRHLAGDETPRAAGTYGERVWYTHYAGPARSEETVLLPPGTPWPADRCPRAAGRPAGALTVDVGPAGGDP